MDSHRRTVPYESHQSLRHVEADGLADAVGCRSCLWTEGGGIAIYQCGGRRSRLITGRASQPAIPGHTTGAAGGRWPASNGEDLWRRLRHAGWDLNPRLRACCGSLRGTSSGARVSTDARLLWAGHPPIRSWRIVEDAWRCESRQSRKYDSYIKESPFSGGGREVFQC